MWGRKMNMNKNLQIQRIAHALKQKGFDADLADLEMDVDSTLSMNENFNNIMQQYSPGFGTKAMMSRFKPDTMNQNKMQRYMEAERISHSTRPNSQRMDYARHAKRRFEMSDLNKKNYNKWKRNPNRFDIVGIDM